MSRLAGFGSDRERVEIEVIHPACLLVHCEGNEMSPFEFSDEAGARCFIRQIGISGVIEQFPELGQINPVEAN